MQIKNFISDKFASEKHAQNLLDSIVDSRFLIINNFLKKINAETIVSWEEINQVLKSCRLRSPRLRLVKEGVDIPEHEYSTYSDKGSRGVSYPVINPNKFWDFLSSSSTMVLNSADELFPNVEELIVNMERFLGVPVQANMYVSFGDTKGLKLHWDLHDVIVFQVFGNKRWSIWGETLQNPTYKIAMNDSVKPKESTWEGLIQEGDIMYMPRGLWHYAEALNEPSIHLAVGILRRKPVDYLQWIVEKAHANDFLRTNIPFYWEKKGETQRRIIDQTESVIGKYSIDQFLEEVKATIKRQHNFNLPISITNKFDMSNIKSLIVCSNICGTSLELDKKGDLVVNYSGYRYTFPKHFKPIIQWLQQNNKPVELKDLVAIIFKEKIMEDKNINDYVLELIKEGMINVTSLKQHIHGFHGAKVRNAT